MKSFSLDESTQQVYVGRQPPQAFSAMNPMDQSFHQQQQHQHQQGIPSQQQQQQQRSSHNFNSLTINSHRMQALLILFPSLSLESTDLLIEHE